MKMKVEFITTQEAEGIKRIMPKSKTMEEYEGFWKQLPHGQVGKMVVSQKVGIKPQTIRSRLIRAGKSLSLTFETKRVSNTILFWREEN
jgi:hypothetical protein